MKNCVLLLSICLAAAPAFAQHGQSTGFMFISPAEASIGRDNNFLVDRTPADQKLLILSLPASVQPAAPSTKPEQLDDTVLYLKAPTVALLRDARRTDFSFTYQPEVELFVRNRDQNAVNHIAGADVNFFFTRHLQFYIGDGFVSSKDATRTLQNVFLLIPRSRYTENAFRTSISYVRSERTSYTVGFDHTVSTYGDIDPLQRRMLDTVGKAGSFTFERMVRRSQRLRLTYAMFKLGPWNRKDDRVDTQFIAFRNPAHAVSGAYRFRVGTNATLEASAGAVRRDTDIGYTFGISGDRQIGNLTLGGSYTRSLSFLTTTQFQLPNGMLPNSFYDVWAFRMRGQPKRKIGLDLNVTYMRSVYNTVAIGSKSFMARSRIDYRLNDSTVWFVGAEGYHQNLNEFVAAPLSRYRYFTGLAYSFSNESQRRTARLNRDAEHVSLTEHARLRNRPQ
jgi:hypothetical protein